MSASRPAVRIFVGSIRYAFVNTDELHSKREAYPPGTSLPVSKGFSSELGCIMEHFAVRGIVQGGNGQKMSW